MSTDTDDATITEAFVNRFQDMDREEQKRRLRGMSDEQLQEMSIRIQERIDDIEAQLQQAKSKAHSSGEYADEDWFNSAQYAKRAFGRNIQYIQMLQSRRSGKPDAEGIESGTVDAALTKIDSLSWKQFFVEEAKARLDEETYDEIAETAGERAREAIPEGFRSR